MFALKITLVLTVLAAHASSMPGPRDQSLLHSDQLPSDKRNNEKPETIQNEVAVYKKTETAKPHRLSKRITNSLLRGYELKRSVSSNPLQDTWVPGEDELSSNHHLKYNNLNSPSYEEILNFVFGLPKPKREFGLLPAKEPRRKDLPPYIGEESAPRFSRAFNLPPIDDRGHTSLRLTSDDLLRNLQSSRFEPLDRAGRQIWAQTFHIHTPINIQHLDVDLGIDDDLNSAYGSAVSSNEPVDYPELTEMAYDDEETDADEYDYELQPDKKEELQLKLKESLQKLLAQLHGQADNHV